MPGSHGDEKPPINRRLHIQGPASETLNATRRSQSIADFNPGLIPANKEF